VRKTNQVLGWRQLLHRQKVQRQWKILLQASESDTQRTSSAVLL